MRRLLVTVITAAAAGVSLVAGLAGCGSGTSGAGATTAPTTSAPTGVTITRTGGIAGVNQTIQIAADGSWTYTDAKTGASQRGSLTQDQRATLFGILATPGLIDQMNQHASAAPTCNDGFHYAITLGSESFAFTDCGGTAAPEIEAVISAIVGATPF